MSITVSHISFAYGAKPVLKNIVFTAEKGEFVCLVGESGSGKSTLLRLIAGLEPIQQGEIAIHGHNVGRHGLEVPAEKRGVGLVFQHPSLFPHLNVLQNVLFGMKTRSEKHAHELLDLVRFRGNRHAYPHMLSGGQHQRVALARALAPTPSVMLLDEPFANMDFGLRKAIREETRQLLKQQGVTTIMVTHDPREALQMADRIILIGPDGSIHQQGTPQDVYDRPVDIEAARFFGPANMICGSWHDGLFTCCFGDILVRSEVIGQMPVALVLRPENIHLTSRERATASGQVKHIMFCGSYQTLSVQCGIQQILVDDFSRTPVCTGQTVYLGMDMQRLHFIEDSAEQPHCSIDRRGSDGMPLSTEDKCLMQ